MMRTWLLLSSAAAVEVKVLHEFTTAEFDWTALNTTRDAALNSGLFVPENNAITGLKVHAGRLFATVPRWRHGVPSTLNTVERDAATGASMLRPWPSAAANDAAAGGLRYVQSMEIDPRGVMWVVDVGRMNFADDAAPTVDGAARMLLLNATSGEHIDEFEIPDDVAPHNASFLNDLAVDVPRDTAYVSDAGGAGALVVVDMRARRAARFADATLTSREPVEMVILGRDYGTETFTTPTDGIALAPDAEWVYWCALQGRTLYRAPASLLRADPLDAAAVVAAAEVVGAKRASADGMAFGADGRLFSGGITDPENSVFSARPPFADGDGALRETTLASQQHWADTFAFDGEGHLLWTTNRLDLFFNKTMDFTGASGSNFRIVTAFVNTTSYMEAQTVPQ